eukprot:scaffold61089_cov59-Attheya_sp.AAC.6
MTDTGLWCGDSNRNSGDGGGADGNDSGGSDAGDEDENENENDDIDMPWMCKKMDQFHAFDAMPSSSDKKTKNVLKMIQRLVIQSTIEFDVEEF